jgi:hypothetical protein
VFASCVQQRLMSLRMKLKSRIDQSFVQRNLDISSREVLCNVVLSVVVQRKELYNRAESFLRI